MFQNSTGQRNRWGRNDLLFIVFASLSLVFQLFLAPHTAVTGDMRSFRDDIREMMVKGRLFNFYHSTDYAYPPLWSWWLIIVFLLRPTLNYSDGIWLTLIKLPTILSNLLLSAVVYYRLRSTQKRLSLPLGLFCLFHPHLIFVGPLWGMFDSIGVFFLFSSITLLSKNRSRSAGILLGLSALTKQYALLTIPFLFCAYRRKAPRRAFEFLFIPLIVFMAASIPYLIFDFSAYIDQVTYGIAQTQVEIRSRSGSLWFLMNLLAPFLWNEVPDWLVRIQYPVFFSIFLLFTFGYCLTGRSQREVDFSSMNSAVLIPTLIFLFFSPVVHAQYFVLLIPFSILAVSYLSLQKSLPLLALTVLPSFQYAIWDIWFDQTMPILIKVDKGIRTMFQILFGDWLWILFPWLILLTSLLSLYIVFRREIPQSISQFDSE
jgi:Gpi18-like mannosyltransferase